MNAAGRLGIYGAGLVAVFAAAFAVSGVVVPENAVTAWAGAGSVAHATDAEQDAETLPEASVAGLSIAASGFVIGAVQAPAEVGVEGDLTFEVLNTEGEPVTEYETAHGKQLHLIVVRSDGSEYRHVHPVLDTSTGTWSLPWTWDAAGTYRAYADFTAGNGTSATLSRTVNVAGLVTPAPSTDVKATDSVDGFDVSISGNLVAGTGSELTVEVTRDGEPVTALEPYLGAFGHLVALREGDLAYLHVHAQGEEPEPGDQAGPAVKFTAEAPTAGRYLLYLDFQVDGQVHTAAFVLDAASPAAGAEDESDTSDDEHSGH
ncbi:heavy-metal-associated domain-containing protein [Microbacterium sp. NPDC076768]|uniref:heavy-metal-associated domain-containing protein n=1 Tax=Microbacterium sp. NPDC076768 TaxID=3154858 RepID=UPI00342E8DEE